METTVRKPSLGGARTPRLAIPAPLPRAIRIRIPPRLCCTNHLVLPVDFRMFGTLDFERCQAALRYCQQPGWTVASDTGTIECPIMDCTKGFELIRQPCDA